MGRFHVQSKPLNRILKTGYIENYIQKSIKVHAVWTKRNVIKYQCTLLQRTFLLQKKTFDTKWKMTSE